MGGNVKKSVILCLMMMLLITSCKTKPEEKKKPPETNPKDQTDDNKNNQDQKKITEEQFAQAEELILRAKDAMGDVYDKDNFNKAVSSLKNARDLNEKDIIQAKKELEQSKKSAEDAYNNAYKLRAIELKNKALQLYADIEKDGIDKKNPDKYDASKKLFNEGEESFKSANYKYSYMKFKETVDMLNDMSNYSKNVREELETNMKYVKGLIDKAIALGAKTYAKEEIDSAQTHYETGFNEYKALNNDKSRSELKIAENDALKAIDKTNAALLAIKKEQALKAIKRAGKKIENASNKKVINSKGETEESIDYKFKFDETNDVQKSPDSDKNITYKDVLTKAIEYIEKAKDSYNQQDYDMAIKYAQIAERIADSYNPAMIKTMYTVRLIPEKRDCLWRISEYDFIYGSPYFWPRIWKSNKTKILNPDLIYPGQVLAVPEIE